MMFLSDWTEKARPAWALGAVLFVTFCATAAFAQQTPPPDASSSQQPTADAAAPVAEAPAAPPQMQTPAPLVDDVNGIELGMTADAVKDKLGKPDTKDATTMFYELDNGAQVQMRFGDDKKVVMVAATYSGSKADAPEFAEVFGTDVQPTRKDNGSIYKMVQYPSKGYWVAYSRLDLDSGPMTTVTMQKIDE